MKKLILLLMVTSIGLAGFISPVDITADADDSYTTSLAVDTTNNIVHAIWAGDMRGGSYDVYYSRSTDYGLTWTSAVNASQCAPFDAYTQAIDVDSNGYQHVVYYLDFGAWADIHYINSTDGVIWSTPVNITQHTSVNIQLFDFKVDSNDNMHLFYAGTVGPDSEVFYANSSDSGKTWSIPVNVTSNGALDDYSSFVIDSSGDFHLVHGESIGGMQTDIIYRKSTDSGKTWSAGVNISNSPGASELPSIALDSNNNVHVVWEDSFGQPNKDIYYANSTDGVTWSTLVNVSDLSGGSHHPDIEIESDDKIHATWYQHVAGANYDINYKYSTDKGKTWSAVGNISADVGTSEWSDSTASKVVIDSNDVIHVSWMNDGVGGQPDIYYSTLFTSPSSGSLTITNISGGSFDETDTTLSVIKGNLNISWLTLTLSDVLSINNRNFDSSFTITSNVFEGSIIMNELGLSNEQATITITGLTGVTSPEIKHDGILVYTHGILTANNDVNVDLVNLPTWSAPTMTFTVAGFQQWGVGNFNTFIGTTAPGFDFAAVVALFALAAVVFVIRKD